MMDCAQTALGGSPPHELQRCPAKLGRTQDAVVFISPKGQKITSERIPLENPNVGLSAIWVVECARGGFVDAESLQVEGRRELHLGSVKNVEE